MFGVDRRRDLGELRWFHDQMMQNIANKSEKENDHGWFEFFSSKKKEQKTTLENGLNNATNNYYNQQILEQTLPSQEQQQFPQMQYNNWNALNTAEYYRNIPQMPTFGVPVAAVYNPNLISVPNEKAPVSPNPYGNYHGHHHNHDTIVPLTSKEVNIEKKKVENHEVKVEKPHIAEEERAQVVKQEKKEENQETQVKKEEKKVEQPVVTKKDINPNEHEHTTQNHSRKHFRHQRNRKIIFDPIPGLFPKVLVNRILKEREVEVIVHGPKGRILRRHISSHDPVVNPVSTST